MPSDGLEDEDVKSSHRGWLNALEICPCPAYMHCCHVMESLRADKLIHHSFRVSDILAAPYDIYSIRDLAVVALPSLMTDLTCYAVLRR